MPMELLMKELNMIPKIMRFKTAYSWAFKCFVEIQRVIPHGNDEYTFECRLAHTSEVYTFKKSELTDFCL